MIRNTRIRTRTIFIVIGSTLLCHMSLLFSGCSRTTGNESKRYSDSAFLAHGDKVVALTFDTLRKSLTHAIGANGVEGAITFCNERAYPITDIYADTVTIKRTSLRYRNPNNKPDTLEESILKEMTSGQTKMKTPQPIIVRDNKNAEVHYFKPIMMQGMCLNCHGKPNTQISESVISRIHDLYPDDRATDFKEGDVRGLWHVIFRMQNSAEAK